MNRSICSLASASKIALILGIIFLADRGYGNCRIKVEEFNITGSPGIIISPADVTKLLWRQLGFPRPYDISVGEIDLPGDSFDLVVDGNCALEGENYFKLDWVVRRTNRQQFRQFSFEGEDLKLVRSALFSSLDSMTAPLCITTDPDSSGLVIDGVYVGEGPLNFDAFAVGWHCVEARSIDGLEIRDSFNLTHDTTTFRYVLAGVKTESYSYVRLTKPPACELYEGLVRKNPFKGNIYRFSPGLTAIRLISPQYGTRELTFTLEPGDTFEISFFARKNNAKSD